MRVVAFILVALVPSAAAYNMLAAKPSAAAGSHSWHARTSSPSMLWRGAKGIPKGNVPDTKGKKECAKAMLEHHTRMRSRCVSRPLLFSSSVHPTTALHRSDKSWGLGEWFSELAGGADAPDTGPKLGGGGYSRGVDDAGNFQGDRRFFKNEKKKTVNDGGVKFNPLDASPW